ncbi:MAG TPA: hypothetical protein VFS91_09395 [Nitrobacter sp.]|nr:hypothetical protein [Nitrobacter sp.]
MQGSDVIIKAKNQNDLAVSAPAGGSDNRPGGFLADEGVFDRRTLWRLGSWGAAAVAAVIIAFLAHNFGTALRHQQIAAANLARQSQQLQAIAKGNENEKRRLSSAIDTLNRDRDRLFARVTVLEQGLDSVTGSISQNAAQNEPQRPPSPKEAALGSPLTAAPLLPQPDKALPSPASLTPQLASAAAAADSSSADSARADKPVTPEASSKPATAAQDPPVTRPGGPNETAAVAPENAEPKKDGEPHDSNDAERKAAQIVTAPIPAAVTQVSSIPAPIPVARTDFGIDLGSSGSIKGLRMLWRSILKSEAKTLASLHPIIMLKERGNGKGMQLRLVAGPLSDAAAAAKICAVLSENGRPCETVTFDGQRLAMKDDENGAAVPAKKPRPSHTSPRHRHNRESARAEEPAPPPPPPAPPKPSGLGSFFSR